MKSDWLDDVVAWNGLVCLPLLNVQLPVGSQFPNVLNFVFAIPVNCPHLAMNQSGYQYLLHIYTTNKPEQNWNEMKEDNKMLIAIQFLPWN